MKSKLFSRRSFLSQSFPVIGGALLLAGCTSSSSLSNSRVSSKARKPDLVIGQRGLSDGRFQKPRAIAIDREDRIFVVDKTGRVQSFDNQGKFLVGWRTPEIESGKPTGISIDSDGSIVVADTHYYRFLFYTPEGKLLDDRTIGGVNGPDPGQFAFVTDIARSGDGNYFCGEYGEYDRIHRYSSEGKFLERMGEHGKEPLQFSRPQCFQLDERGFLWVADACNHRIQVIDWRSSQPISVSIFGRQGIAPGELQYPYGLHLFKDNSIVVSEFGNHRVQLLDRSGGFLDSWGTAGGEPGELNQPWATAIDSRSRIYVVDSGNNRIQRFQF